jgi:hypothetical protein
MLLQVHVAYTSLSSAITKQTSLVTILSPSLPRSTEAISIYSSTTTRKSVHRTQKRRTKQQQKCPPKQHKLVFRTTSAQTCGLRTRPRVVYVLFPTSTPFSSSLRSSGLYRSSHKLTDLVFIHSKQPADEASLPVSKTSSTTMSTRDGRNAQPLTSSRAS